MDSTEPQGAKPSMRRFLKLEDVADVLATTPAQVYALVRRGELPAIKLGGRGQWRVENTALDEFIKTQYEQTRAWVAANPFAEGRGQQGAGHVEPDGDGTTSDG